MDNSIKLLYDMVKKLQSDIEAYSAALRMHAITIPREKLEQAVQYGFPEDIYSYYMNKYYVQNEAAAEGVISDIKQNFIPYLENVAYNLHEAMTVGSGVASASVLSSKSDGASSIGGTSGPSVFSNPTSTSRPPRPQGVPSSKFMEDLALRTQQLIMKNEAIDKNNRDLENKLGIKKGVPMSVEEADKQNANPNHTFKYLPDSNGDFYMFNEEIYKRRWWTRFSPISQEIFENSPRYKINPDYKEEFSINCATCATAYALRLRGFDVKAKGNPGKVSSDSLNSRIADAEKYPDVWRNPDGTKVEPVHTDDWMKKNGIREMTTEDYRRYFNETCKETGVYVVMVRYADDKSGHATILQRDADGVLYYVEPQVYESNRSVDGKRSLDDLLMSKNGKLRLSSNPSHAYGVMRVDDKIFNTEYADIFESK